MTSRRLHAGALLLSLCLNSQRALGEANSNTVGASSSAVQRCIELHERARIQRVQEQWLSARDAMTQCAEDSCPLALRVDCQDWLVELARALPTVLIVVERAEGDTSPLQLELDGRSLELPEPFGPLELLPGTHRVRAWTATAAPVELELSLEKGEKNRVLHLRFTRPTEPRQEPPRPLPTQPMPASEPHRPVPALTYGLSAGALAALATSGVLLGSALSSLHAARESCAPGCDPSVRRSIDGRLLAADVFGGAGITLAAFALYTFLSRPTEPRDSGLSGFALLRGGAALSLGRRF